MALTDILAISESVGINDQRFVGQVVSRNQMITTSEILTVVPFAFEMKPMNYLLYRSNRALLNSLRVPDKALIQYLNFGSTGWVNYITYQGDMGPDEIAQCTWMINSAGKNLVLGFLPSLNEDQFVVRQGDFCQVGLYSYIATADVVRGVDETVTIPVHRNLLTPVTAPLNAVIGQWGDTVAMGGNVYTGTTFPVVLREYPTYTLMPYFEDSYIQWSGTFKAFEAVI